MKRLTAWELLKDNPRTAAQDWVHEIPLVSYGVITRVIDAQTVDVKALVQTSTSGTEQYTVQLLTPSSMLFETYAQPLVGDTVLLLFVQRYAPGMFDDPAEREVRTGRAVMVDPDAAGYTRFSGIGILMRTVRASSALTVSVLGNKDSAGVQVRSAIDVSAVFSRAVSLLFDDPHTDREHAVQALFGEQSPYDEEHWAKTHRQYGMRELPDGSLAEVDAAVDEEYSRFAPITKTIQGSQTYTIGTDNNGEATDAPVVADLNEKSDITLTSKSGMAAKFEKSVTVSAGDLDLVSEEPVGINDGLYSSALKPYLNSETDALKALQQAATQAAPQLAVLDALSGGTGFIAGLGTAIISFCTSMQSADSSAHSTISKAVK
jgi:hypothetical protein